MPSPLIFSPAPNGGKNGFSDASPHAFRLDGSRWPTVAHYMYAQRFADTPLADDIRAAPSVAAAEALARESAQPVRADWAQVDNTLLDKALLAKFRAHPTQRAQLLATENRPLIEEPNFPLGTVTLFSRNTLGFALMRVRSTLRRSEAQKRRQAPRPLPATP